LSSLPAHHEPIFAKLNNPECLACLPRINQVCGKILEAGTGQALSFGGFWEETDDFESP
jgi:hypothetical protein